MKRKTVKHALSMFYTLIKRVFYQSEHAQGPIYIIKQDKAKTKTNATHACHKLYNS